jgi:hypothetical protein
MDRRYGPRVLRTAAAAFFTVLAASGLATFGAASAQAAPGAMDGIQDDAWLLYGPGTLEERLTTLDDLGVQVVRFTLRWDQVAPTRPATPRRSTDPAYRWGAYGDVLDGLHALGIPALVTLYGSPRWANAHQAANRLPLNGFGDFAYAASKRFPWVRMWTAWNEPNSRTFAVPASPSAYVRRVLNPAYASLHAASRANRVGGGETSPRATPSGMAPLAFMSGMRAAHARLDAYAQHPYPVDRAETPFQTSCPHCGYFTMARLADIRADVTRYFGAKPLWLTEYGYQTNPPDRLLGVSYGLQARYVGEAALHVWEQPGVTLLIQFLVRDEPSVGGWQSGLFTASGTPKPAYHAFALPLAERARRGSQAVLWGQVRPGTGRRAYQLQRSTAAGWRTVGGAGRTDARGTFSRTVALPPGTRVRVSAPSVGWSSPALTLS